MNNFPELIGILNENFEKIKEFFPNKEKLILDGFSELCSWNSVAIEIPYFELQDYEIKLNSQHFIHIRETIVEFNDILKNIGEEQRHLILVGNAVNRFISNRSKRFSTTPGGFWVFMYQLIAKTYSFYFTPIEVSEIVQKMDEFYAKNNWLMVEPWKTFE